MFHVKCNSMTNSHDSDKNRPQCLRLSTVTLAETDSQLFKSCQKVYLDCDPGLPGTGSCCQPDNTCGEGEGDCDKNEDCDGDLICGTNNCRKWNPAAPAAHDCCQKSNSQLILPNHNRFF